MSDDLHIHRGRGEPNEVDPQSRMLASRVLALLDDSTGARLTVNEIAQRLGVDRFRLHRAFVRCHGVPPHRYDLARRIRRAAGMLEHGAKAKVAAQATGFQSLTYFSRRFRAVMGVSPSDYKREARRARAKAS